MGTIRRTHKFIKEIFSNRTMKRNFHSLILKACFTIIVISFVNVLVAKTIKGEKSDSKVDLNVDKPKDCVRRHRMCCYLRTYGCPENQRKDCLKPLCSELACKEKKCGEFCYYYGPGKCNRKGKCSKKTKNLKCGKCQNRGEKCGRHPIKGSKDYGKCCEGPVCVTPRSLGRIGKCLAAKQKQSQRQLQQLPQPQQQNQQQQQQSNQQQQQDRQQQQNQQEQNQQQGQQGSQVAKTPLTATEDPGWDKICKCNFEVEDCLQNGNNFTCIPKKKSKPRSLPKNECPEFNPPGCMLQNGCKDGEVCCTCAPCRRGDMCFKTSCPEWDKEVPEKCYKNKNTTQDSGKNKVKGFRQKPVEQNKCRCKPGEVCFRGTCHIRREGRPFIVDGRYRATTSLVGQIDESNAKTAWNIDQVPEHLANSSLNQEISLAFSNQGEGEHASVASFARHTLQLMSMGAPATLLVGSQQAALDEIRHAKMCYGIAT